MFELLGVALVGLSAVVAAAVLVYTIGPGTLTAVASPFVLGTVVFTAAVALVVRRATSIVERKTARTGGNGH